MLDSVLLDCFRAAVGCADCDFKLRRVVRFCVLWADDYRTILVVTGHLTARGGAGDVCHRQRVLAAAHPAGNDFGAPDAGARYCQYTVNINILSIYCQYTVNILSIYCQYTVNTYYKVDNCVDVLKSDQL